MNMVGMPIGNGKVLWLEDDGFGGKLGIVVDADDRRFINFMFSRMRAQNEVWEEARRWSPVQGVEQ